MRRNYEQKKRRISILKEWTVEEGDEEEKPFHELIGRRLDDLCLDR